MLLEESIYSSGECSAFCSCISKRLNYIMCGVGADLGPSHASQKQLCQDKKAELSDSRLLAAETAIEHNVNSGF